MLSQSDVTDLIHDRLYPLFRAERERLNWIDLWMRWEQEEIEIPARSTREQRNLRDLARTPWLGLVVNATSQAQVVDGHRSPTSQDNTTAWEIWRRNKLGSRQHAIHHAANGYGYAYGKAMPGIINGERRARLTAVDPSHMIAVYADELEDEWPMFALHGRPAGDQWLMKLYDDEIEYIVSVGASGDRVEFVEWRGHEVGVCPIVRYAPFLDLRGRAIGEVEPFIGLAKRLNKNVHDRLLAQHYNSWKIRTATGLDLAKGLTEPTADSTAEEWATYRAEVEKRRIQLGQSDMLVARDHETRFGVLDETPLDGFVRVDESDQKTLAAVSQTPITAFAELSNVSADTIAEIRNGWSQKVAMRRDGIAESHNQLLRLGSHIEGDDEAANDFQSGVTWQDMQVRSMAQAADALGKLATMLGVPVQALWPLVPGVEKADVDQWKTLAAEGDAFATLSNVLEQQAGAI
jgi:hypothetical protein